MVNALGDATKLRTVDWAKDWTFAQDSAKFCELECLKSSHPLQLTVFIVQHFWGVAKLVSHFNPPVATTAMVQHFWGVAKLVTWPYGG